MEAFRCAVSLCTTPATFHLTRIETRVCVEETWVCPDHVRDLLHKYSSAAGVASVVGQGLNGFTGCDMEVILYDQKLFEEGTCCWIYLREVGGSRWFVVPTGYFETSNLEWELRRHHFRRPPTHRIVCGLINAIGGRLEHALVDEYHEDEGIYDAKLHVIYPGGSLKIDARPIDAFAVAVACDAPILVANGVLRKAGV
jgi:bifunctional DNase/RNase